MLVELVGTNANQFDLVITNRYDGIAANGRDVDIVPVESPGVLELELVDAGLEIGDRGPGRALVEDKVVVAAQSRFPVPANRKSPCGPPMSVSLPFEPMTSCRASASSDSTPPLGPVCRV